MYTNTCSTCLHIIRSLYTNFHMVMVVNTHVSLKRVMFWNFVTQCPPNKCKGFPAIVWPKYCCHCSHGDWTINCGYTCQCVTNALWLKYCCYACQRALCPMCFDWTTVHSMAALLNVWPLFFDSTTVATLANVPCANVQNSVATLQHVVVQKGPHPPTHHEFLKRTSTCFMLMLHLPLI